MVATRKYKFKLRKRFRQRTSRRNRRTNRNNNANRRTRNKTIKGGMFSALFRKSPTPSPTPLPSSPIPSASSSLIPSAPSSPTPSSASDRSTPSPSPPRASGIDAVNANFEEANREVTDIVPEINEKLVALETAISKMDPALLRLYKESIVIIKEHFKAKIETMQQSITERRDAFLRGYEERLAKFEEENSKLMADFKDERDQRQRTRLKAQIDNKIKEMNQFSGKIDADARNLKSQNHHDVIALRTAMRTIIDQLQRNIVGSGNKGYPQRDPLHNIRL